MKNEAGTNEAGLRAIFAEMDRQHEDARRSFDEAGEMARSAAQSMQRTGRLVLLGMGASHAVNRMAESGYRDVGLDATAMPISEALGSPPARAPRTVVLTSQSGESGEIIRYLQRDTGSEERFGLTLNRAGALAAAVPSLIGAGGMEEAFAATRSLIVSLALHARILHELGAARNAAFLPDAAAPDLDAAAQAFAAVRAIAFVGTGAMVGVAEAAALGVLELARLPSFALEAGQFRHGPLEALGADLGVVVLRDATSGPDPTAAQARICAEAGSPCIVFDASGLAPVAGAITVGLPAASGLAAAFAVLPPMQRLVIAIASRRVADAGTPLRTSKVTRDA